MLHRIKQLFKVGLSLSIGIGLCCITLIAIAYPYATPEQIISISQDTEQFDCPGDPLEQPSQPDWIIKLCSSDQNITQTMDVYLDGNLAGSAVYVQVYHTTETDPDRAPQIAAFYTTGFVRLKPTADPPQMPLDFGASAILGVAYWSDSNTYHHNPQITELHFDTGALPTGPLQIKAVGVNQNFNIGYAMELPPPTDVRTELYVTQTYTATAPVTIPLGRHNRAEGFKLVQLSANYVNSTTHDSDAAGFITPDGRYREVLFEQLIPPQSFFLDALPLHSRYRRLDLTKRHLPEIDNFPNIRLEILDAPDDPTIIPRGWFTETIDPLANNVNIWLSSRARSNWSPGETSTISYRIIAQTDPLDFGCPVQSNSICVLDEHDSPVADALVYRTRDPDAGDGAAKTLLGQTDIRGLLPLSVTLGSADELVALQLVHEQPTDKDVHTIAAGDEDFAFRVYRTTMPISDSGKVTFPVISAGNQHVLRIDPQSPLILFHVVVSIEAEVSRHYVSELMQGLQQASDLLYDATDGTMAFGWVSVWDGREHFDDADIQIHSNNLTWPHAYVGGINTSDPEYHLVYKGMNPTAGKIVLGRYFDGTTSAQGAWNQQPGYSTIVHEFAHYALFLYDEYFYIDESNGSRLAKPSYCFAQIDSNLEKLASIMDYQYTTTEFCNRPEHYPEHQGGPPTQQTQQYGPNETSWVTIQGVYSDTLQQMHSDLPPWEIRSPVDRDVAFVDDSETFMLGTQVYDHTGVDVSVTKLITVTHQGEPVSGVLVSLHLANGSRPMDQGITNPDGTVDVLGGAIGDRILVRTINNGYAGSLTLTHTIPESIDLQPVVPADNRSSTDWSSASQIVPLVTSIPDSNGTSMIYHVALDRADLELTAELHGIQPTVTKSIPYSEVEGLHVVSFDGLPARTNLIDLELSISPSLTDTLVSGIGIGNHRSWTDGTVDLEITSPDGNLEVNAASDHLTSERYVALNPTYALPGPPPAGMTVVSGPYSIQGSAAETGWGQPMALTFNYHSHASGDMPKSSLQPYYWSAGEEQWQPITTTMSYAGRQQVSASSKLYGIYALMGTPTTTSFEVFLPVVHNQ